MAYFDDAYKLTKEYEGGYANLKGDNGGETMWGIARNYWGDDKDLRQFWRELDFYKSGLQNLMHTPKDYTSRLNALCAGNTAMVSACKAFYRREFWDKARLGDIHSQKIANLVYDWFVNSGKSAIKRIQRCAGVADDGIIGNATISAINSANEADFINRVCDSRIEFYKGLNKPQFERGWVARAEKFRV